MLESLLACCAVLLISEQIQDKKTVPLPHPETPHWLFLTWMSYCTGLMPGQLSSMWWCSEQAVLEESGILLSWLCCRGGTLCRVSFQSILLLVPCMGFAHSKVESQWVLQLKARQSGVELPGAGWGSPAVAFYTLARPSGKNLCSWWEKKCYWLYL